jgi:heavy metal translocating P-type ATPase
LVGAGLVVYLTGWLRSIFGLDLAMLLALGGGLPIYFDALGSLVRRKISANLAVSLAAFAALYLGYTGAYEENMYAVAAEVIFIVLIGESLEHFAVGRTRQGIAALLTLRPEQARVRRNGREETVAAAEIRRDDVVLVRPGDRIPVDGRVLAGSSSIDQSPITGESLPADKTLGDEVFAGTINLYGALELSVERLGEDTTLEQIIHLVEEAEAAKAPSQRLADRYAGYFVPIVLLIAGLTYVFTGETYFTSGDMVRTVAVLVVACPCALVLATPTAIAAGIGSLVRRGVLIKGGVVLENLGRLRSVVFDKTGTLTLAKLRISQIVPAPGCDEAEVLRLAASVERHSEHPVGRLIAERANSQGIELTDAGGFIAHPGLGAEAIVSGTTVRVGNPRFIEQSGVTVPEELQTRIDDLGRSGCTVVLVARGAETVGAVAVEDTVRPEARETIQRLRGLGIERIEMLTGDNAAAAESVAKELSIEQVQSGLLPADKVQAVRRIGQQAAPVAMVGDGINDAPSLATADVGVAMAEIGTDVAIASADLVLVGDDLRKLADAIACGRKALRIVWQNIVGFALVFNVVAVAAASFGWMDVMAAWFGVSSPVVAAVVHQVSSLTVALNSMRLLVDFHRW